MPRRPITFTSAIVATAALAVGPGCAASTRSTPKTVSCQLALLAQGPPNLSASPSAIQFGLVACPRPLGEGVHYDTHTVTPTGPGHGTIAGAFKNYDRGTRSGTFALTFAATTPWTSPARDDAVQPRARYKGPSATSTAEPVSADAARGLARSAGRPL